MADICSGSEQERSAKYKKYNTEHYIPQSHYVREDQKKQSVNDALFFLLRVFMLWLINRSLLTTH